jgi:hypothetical protein
VVLRHQRNVANSQRPVGHSDQLRPEAMGMSRQRKQSIYRPQKTSQAPGIFLSIDQYRRFSDMVPIINLPNKKLGDVRP